jgi:hypothetical protein
MDTMNGFPRHPCSRKILLFAVIATGVLAACDSDRSNTTVGEDNGARTVDSAMEATAAIERPKTLAAVEEAVVENPLKTAYFGELHVHTSFSLDAYIAGTRLTPDSAYRPDTGCKGL